MHILLYVCTEQTYVFWYQRSVLILRALFVSFYHHVLHLMECSCYCCLVIVVITILSYCVIIVCFVYWFPLDCFVSVVSSHVSLYARVILFSSPCPRLSISLCSSVSSREESHPELFPTPSSSEDSRASYSRSKDRSKSIINPSVVKMYSNR